MVQPLLKTNPDPFLPNNYRQNVEKVVAMQPTDALELQNILDIFQFLLVSHDIVQKRVGCSVLVFDGSNHSLRYHESPRPV